ncbi:MAG TPA: nucleoside transporter C-terminal domain-containing protein [Burkholderiales bacterium]|nr:nucleoside transporter C-terminal domain-containing protein [Burkholderiales bacterium]
MADSIHALTGMAGLLALAWAASENRRAIPWRAVVAGLALLVVLAIVFLRIEFLKKAFLKLNDLLLVLERATQAGTSLVFGYVGGGNTPFTVSDPASNFVLAFRALPIVLVMSALSALLFYWRVLPAVVRAISFMLERTMRIGGVVGLSTAANVFVGMVEAPLFVRPYLARVSRGELFAIMAGGMASIAGTVLFLYGAILGRVQPDAVAHLLIASILSAPAALVIAFLMVPPETTTGGDLALRSEASSSMDALTRGTLDGAQLLLNIVAMLVVFVALVALVNLVIAPYTLQGALGWALAPLAWLAGIPWSEARAAGALLGTKTVINELVAYLDLSLMENISDRSRLLLTYALCGFANFGSLGIMIGGLGTMSPERRGEIVGLGVRSIVAGTLATCLTAATVALVL